MHDCGPALLTTVDEAGVKLVEGDPDQRLLSRPDDATRVIEACISAGADAALLYARNLTDLFFDLSSGEAGAVLQKLRNYRVRLAVVCAPGTVRFSTRFSEVLAEERRGRHFGVFDTRAEAVQWLGRYGSAMGVVDLAAHPVATVTEFQSMGAESAELATGRGEAHVHVVRMIAGGIIGRHEAGFDQIFLVLSGVGWLDGSAGRVKLEAGQLGFIRRGEVHSKGATTDLTALIVQVSELRRNEE